MKTLEMNPSLKTYEVVLRWVSLPNYCTKVKATNAMLARDKAVEKHRLATGCGKDELLDCLATTSLFAGKHLWLNDELYAKPSNDGMALRSQCGYLVGFHDSSASTIALHSALLAGNVAEFIKRGQLHTVVYC